MFSARSLSRRPAARLLALCIFGLYVGISLFLFHQAAYLNFPDTGQYLIAAHLRLFSIAFFTSLRPFTTPLIFKLVRYDPASILLFYLFFSWISWGALAVAVARLCRTRFFQVLGFVSVLLIALSPQMIIWQSALLSESPSFSLFALLAAGLLFLLDFLRWQPRPSLVNQAAWASAFLIILTGWSFTRDSNPYVLLLAAGSYVVYVLVRLVFHRQNWQLPVPLLTGLIIGGICLIFAAQNASAVRGDRWQFSLVNVIGQRILTSPEATAYFAERGLPTDSGVRRFTGHWAWEYGQDWVPFQPWLDTKGRSTYLHYLLSHPAEAVLKPFGDWDQLVNQDPGWEYGHYDPPAWLALTAAAWPRSFGLALEALLAGGLFFLAVRRRPRSSLLWTGFALTALAVPAAMICWQGDAMEIARHALGVALQLRLGLLFLILFSLDILNTAAQTSHDQPSRPHPSPPLD